MYSRKIGLKSFTFGISGRLYKSNVLLYDHQTESLWSQLKNKAISGPMVGAELKQIEASRVTWRAWKKRFPRTLVLSKNTGFTRDYSIDPYKGYYRVGTIMFPVGKVRKDLPTKEMVLGVSIKGKAKAYRLNYIRSKPQVIQDWVGAEQIIIRVRRDRETISVTTKSGKKIPHMYVYWFAWQAYHPETKVYGR